MCRAEAGRQGEAAACRLFIYFFLRSLKTMDTWWQQHNIMQKIEKSSLALLTGLTGTLCDTPCETIQTTQWTCSALRTDTMRSNLHRVRHSVGDRSQFIKMWCTLFQFQYEQMCLKGAVFMWRVSVWADGLLSKCFSNCFEFFEVLHAVLLTVVQESFTQQQKHTLLSVTEVSHKAVKFKGLFYQFYNRWLVCWLVSFMLWHIKYHVLSFFNRKQGEDVLRSP